MCGWSQAASNFIAMAIRRGPAGNEDAFSSQLFQSNALIPQSLFKPDQHTTNMAVGKPRTDAYLRLLHRLHEPLTLLKMALGKHTLGPHLVNHHEPANLAATRRRFLRNLAYTCDFSKGGKSVASIGAEEREECFVLWLALNENDHGRGAAILRDTLQ